MTKAVIFRKMLLIKLDFSSLASQTCFLYVYHKNSISINIFYSIVGVRKQIKLEIRDIITTIMRITMVKKKYQGHVSLS